MRQDSRSQFTQGLLLVAAVTLLIALPFMTWPYLLGNWDSLESDQGAYLELGLDIRNGIGLTDGNRHPLFPLILSLFASSEWSYFTTAKLLSLGITLLALTILMLLNARLFNGKVALLSVALTVFNAPFLEASAGRVIAEPLLILFFILTIYFWYQGLVKDRAKFFVLAGMSAGLAFLAKGTAQLLLASFAIWALMTGSYRKRWLEIAGFIVAYLATALPLLLYNVQHWANPFYNFNSTHAMWYDDWDDKYLLPNPTTPTVGSYFASHNLTDVLKRWWLGERVIVQKRGPLLFPLYSVVLLLVAVSIRVLGVWNLRRGTLVSQSANSQLPSYPLEDVKVKAILIPVVVLAVWFVFFAWYSPISNAPRHFVVILPLINTTVSALFVYAFASVTSKWINRYFSCALAIAVIAASLYASMNSVRQLKESYSTYNVYASDVQNNREIDELLYGLESTNGQVVVISGPSQLIPSWRARKTTLTIQQIPNEVNSMDRLSTFISDTGASYLIIDPQVVSRRPFLREYFSLEGARDLEIIDQVPNMTLMADYTLNRQPIMIFERES